MQVCGPHQRACQQHQGQEQGGQGLSSSLPALDTRDRPFGKVTSYSQDPDLHPWSAAFLGNVHGTTCWATRCLPVWAQALSIPSFEVSRHDVMMLVVGPLHSFHSYTTAITRHGIFKTTKGTTAREPPQMAELRIEVQYFCILPQSYHVALADVDGNCLKDTIGALKRAVLVPSRRARPPPAAPAPLL